MDKLRESRIVAAAVNTVQGLIFLRHRSQEVLVTVGLFGLRLATKTVLLVAVLDRDKESTVMQKTRRAGC